VNAPEIVKPRTLRDLVADVLVSQISVGLLGFMVLAFAGLGVALSPASRAGLAFGDLLAGLSLPSAAATHYDYVAERNVDPELRAEALRRSTAIWSLELGDRIEARKRLFLLAELGVDAPEAASIHAEIGALFDEQQRPRQAARHYQKAHDLHPDGGVAARRLVRAAEILQREGLDTLALLAWSQLAKTHPEHRTRADVGRAQIYLARGEEQRALGLFERAEGGSQDIAALSRLGAATCLERLGNLDEALAALDASDLPSEVLELRAGHIIDRADRWEGARSDVAE